MAREAGPPRGQMPPDVSVSRRWLEIAVLAVVYFVLARLSLLLSIPPGYASGVWPSAGVSLAAVLVFGNRIAPGVFLGSFLANLPTTFDASTTELLIRSLALPGVVALGPMVQALAAAALIRRFVGFPNPLVAERSVIGFMVLGGPVGCLVASTWSTAILGTLDAVSTENLGFSWWTWWVGDTIGTVIFAPLGVIAATKGGRSARERVIAVGLPMAVTFTLAVILFTSARSSERRNLENEFDRRTENLMRLLTRDLDSYKEVLGAISGFMDSTETVDQGRFGRFVSGFLQRHPGIQAFSWNPVVTAGERAAFEAERRKSNPGFEIKEADGQNRRVRAPERPLYSVIDYVVPLQGNEAAVGFNTYSEASRMRALDRARDTGAPAATGRVVLVQDSGRRAGVVIYLPVYRRGSLDGDVEARRRAHLGFVGTTFRVNPMLESSLRGADRAGIELVLLDEGEDGGGQELFNDRATPLSGGKRNPFVIHREIKYEFAGRNWAFHFYSKPDAWLANRSWQGWTVLAVGFLFSGLLGAFMLVVTGHAQNVEHQVIERTAALRTSEEQLRLLVESVRDYAILMLDPSGNVVSWNAGGEMMKGYTAAEIVGRHFSLFYTAESRRDGWPQKLLETARQEGRAESEGWRVRKDGTLFWADGVISRIQDSSGRLIGYAKVTRDLSERQRAATLLAERNTALEGESKRALEASRLKSEFLANMSHELRTPLNGVIGFTEFLIDRKAGPLTDDQAEFLNDVLNSARHLLNLINDLLDLAKIEAGRMELFPEPTSIRELVEEVVNVLDLSAHRKILTLDTKVTVTPDRRVVDRQRFRQILYNLLSNAVKFTPAGGRVEVRAESLDSGLRLGVRDTGIGISAEDLQRLFVEFQQLESGATRRYQGTGLGLALTKKLVDLHGGMIRVESKLGEGSHFVVLIPHLPVAPNSPE